MDVRYGSDRVIAVERIKSKILDNNSLLCVGLDVERGKLPDISFKSAWRELDFIEHIIDATFQHVCCYKINAAFFEAFYPYSEALLSETLSKIVERDIPILFDGKRSDIGNSARLYADFIYGKLNVDATTVIPFFGGDGLEPFLKFQDKLTFAVAYPSNLEDNVNDVFRNNVIVSHYRQNLGFVIGANHGEILIGARRLHPETWFLVPGIGAQGADLRNAVTNSVRCDSMGVIFPVSRDILYQSSGSDFAERAGQRAKYLKDEINRCR